MKTLDERRSLLLKWGYGSNLLTEMTDSEVDQLLHIEAVRRATLAQIAFSIGCRKFGESCRAAIPAIIAAGRALEQAQKKEGLIR
jgi:hypothetical protein